MSREEKTLVSVIVPVYNVQDYVETCVYSILDQTYENIEVILVDDGSTDQSSRLCDELSTRDNRIRVIHKENGGLSDARNAGLAIAKGDWIAFVDSDDSVSSQYVECLLDTAIEHNTSIAICDVVHSRSQANQNYSYDKTTELFTFEEAIAEMLYQNSFLPSAWAKIYKKEIFDGILFPVGKLFEDIAIMGSLFERSPAIAYLHSSLYTYVHREGSITTHAFCEDDCFILDISNDYLERYKDTSFLLDAAKAYSVNCQLRVWLNAPDNLVFYEIKKQCANVILKDWRQVFLNKRIRKKLKLALVGFVFFRPALKAVYPSIDRWG